MKRFRGKSVLVTGAANGIGLATAEQFAQEGAAVCLFDREGRNVTAALRRLKAKGFRAIGATGDITRRADIKRAIRATIQHFGQLDVLIANAGVTDVQPLLEIDDARWRRVIEVNVNGTFFCLQEASREMAKTGGGAIVVTASTNAFWVEAGLSAYNTSKGAVVALVRSAALDLAPAGIRVNAVEPGVVRTRFASFVTDDPVAAKEYCAKIPLNRFAEASDVADAILFLASSGASYITGQALVIDGGLTLGLPLGDILSSLPKPGKTKSKSGKG